MTTPAAWTDWDATAEAKGRPTVAQLAGLGTTNEED